MVIVFGLRERRRRIVLETFIESVFVDAADAHDAYDLVGFGGRTTLERGRFAQTIEAFLSSTGISPRQLAKPALIEHKMSILYCLMEYQTARFNEMRRYLGNVTDRTLSANLKELEADRLVSRHVYQQMPPKVKYSLTP